MKRLPPPVGVRYPRAAAAASVAEVLGTYVTARRAIRREPDIEILVRGFRDISDDVRPDPATVAQQRRLANIAGRVLRFLPGDTRCLTRTVVIARMLARRGRRATVVIGVRTEPAFGAHAWLEVGGEPLTVPIDPGGERLLEIP